MLPNSWKRDFASGLVVLIPIILTIYVVAVLFRFLAQVPLLTNAFAMLDPTSATLLRVLFIIALFVLVVLSVGYLMRTTLGDVTEDALDGVMNQIPGLRIVYNASKMAVETAVSGTEDLQTPVKLETWNGMRMTAFKTGKTAADGREVLFLPTSPNITTGYVIEVTQDRYEEIDESVEDALTRVLSAGFGETQGRGGVPIDVVEQADGGEPSGDSEGSPTTD
jgi:uncharacterized membrane protein